MTSDHKENKGIRQQFREVVVRNLVQAAQQNKTANQKEAIMQAFDTALNEIVKRIEEGKHEECNRISACKHYYEGCARYIRNGGADEAVDIIKEVISPKQV